MASTRQQPRAFYDYIRNKDYGLSPEIPADKRTLNQFRRFTGRAEGLSISFETGQWGARVGRIAARGYPPGGVPVRWRIALGRYSPYGSMGRSGRANSRATRAIT